MSLLRTIAMLRYSKGKEKEDEMIGVDNIIELLKLVVYTGHIKGEQPVSVFGDFFHLTGKNEAINQTSQTV